MFASIIGSFERSSRDLFGRADGALLLCWPLLLLPCQRLLAHLRLCFWLDNRTSLEINDRDLGRGVSVILVSSRPAATLSGGYDRLRRSSEADLGF